MSAASAQIVMMPFDFAHGGREGGREGERPEEGGERRNGRNTRVWHKKNLDTGMRRRERKEQMRDCGTELRVQQTDKRGKVYKAIHMYDE